MEFIKNTKEAFTLWTLYVVLFSIHFCLYIDFFGFTADDAFLVARYAENLVEHGDLSFNVGEPILALTSPLHALIESTLYYITDNTILANKLLAVVGTVSSLGILFRRFSMKVLLVPTSIIVTSPFFAIWAVGGLETPYLTICFLLICYFYFLYCEKRNGVYAQVVLILSGLALLLRYDSVLFVSPLCIYMLLSLYYENKSPILHALTPSLILISWFTFALSYYGSILPTSFHVKKSKSISELGVGLVQLTDFVLFSGILLFCAIILSLDWSELKKFINRARIFENRYVPILAGCLVYFLVYGIYAGSSHMMFSFRFFVPLLGIISPSMAFYLRGENKNVHGTDGLLYIIAVVIIALNITSWSVIHYASINPTRHGEYQRVNIHEYQTQFIGVVKGAADSLRHHWSQVSSSRKSRPMRVCTGLQILAYSMQESYFIQPLGTLPIMRKMQKPPPQYCDYTLIHGKPGKPDLVNSTNILKKNGQHMIWQKNTKFNSLGWEGHSWRIFYNPSPISSLPTLSSQ